MVLEYFDSHGFSAPCIFHFQGLSFKVRYYKVAPVDFTMVYCDEKSALSALKDVGVVETSPLPPQADEKVKTLLSDPSYLALFSPPVVSRPPITTPHPTTPKVTPPPTGPPQTNFLEQPVPVPITSLHEDMEEDPPPNVTLNEGEGSDVDTGEDTDEDTGEKSEGDEKVNSHGNNENKTSSSLTNQSTSPSLSEDNVFSPGSKHPRDTQFNVTPPDNKKSEITHTLFTPHSPTSHVPQS